MNDEVELLKRRLEREIKARKQAEMTLEVKALDLYNANETLKQLNNELAIQVSLRSSALESSEARYKELVENASDIIFNISTEGRFTYVNKLGILALGYEEEEVIGQLFTDFIAPKFKEKVAQHYTTILSEGHEKDYFEFPILHKNGSARWVGQNLNRVTTSNGEVYFSSITRDIDQRKRTEFELEKAQKELEKSEVKYRSIIENMELGLLEVDNSGVITRVYDRFNEMTGYTGDELVGKVAIDQLTVPEYESLANEQIEKRTKGATGVYEIQIRKKDGIKLWVIVSGAPFYNEKGEVIGSIGIHYDITERKRLQEELEQAKKVAEEAQEAEKLFLASMSHEIRTPLNAIIGMSHLLEETSLNASQQEYLKIMQSSARILKHLISDILDLSKIDSGNIQPLLAPVDVCDLCESMVTTFKYKNINPQTSWELNIEPEAQQFVMADQQMLTQVLINLLSNAEKFTAKGSILLNVAAETISSRKKAFTFEVIDTGIGISESSLLNIFERFKQASHEISQTYGGTGLGLAISQKLVALLGGELKVDSTEGVGSTFYFTLTLEIDTTQNSVGIQAKQVNEKSIDGTGNHLLIAEDNPMNIKYLTALLDKWNFSYIITNNGKEAVETFADNVFDLILMDLQMPVMDGFEATKQIRSTEKGATIPIIALTASTFIEKMESALEMGMTDFLGKPFAPDDFSRKLRKYLKPEQHTLTVHHNFCYHPQLDSAYLKEAYGDDLNHTLEIMELFMEVVPEGITKLQQAAEEHDQKAIQDHAHRIKPTFTMVGLTYISALAGHIERYAKASDLDNAVKELKALEEELKVKMHLIEGEIERLKTHLKL